MWWSVKLAWGTIPSTWGMWHLRHPLTGLTEQTIRRMFLGGTASLGIAREAGEGEGGLFEWQVRHRAS
jgi:hypothetical protein